MLSVSFEIKEEQIKLKWEEVAHTFTINSMKLDFVFNHDGPRKGHKDLDQSLKPSEKLQRII